MTKKSIQPRWFFPSNTNNLRMILAQGLMTSPSGFSKYYQDVLEDCHGFLPLFKKNVPKKHIDKARAEADHLTPCLLELELDGIFGSVWVKKSNENEYIQASLQSSTTDWADDIDIILIPLPLPIACIKKIIFQHKKDIENFKKDVEIRSNVLLTGLKLQATIADSKLFEEQQLGFDKTVESNSDKLNPSIDLKKPDYPLIYAYGGMLSLLFYFAKNGEKSDLFFKQFIQKDATLNSDSKHQIPNFVYNFFYSDVDQSKSEVTIIEGIIDCCIKSTDATDFKNKVINFLKDDSWGHELAERKEELAQQFQAYATYSPQTVSESFHEAKTAIEKLLLMLFTRKDSTSFIEYNNDNIRIEEQEYILFALFFGIRDGFIKTAPMIRKYQGLQAYISYKMADYAHKTMGSGISFTEIQPPRTVWQFVGENISKQTVRLMNIKSCVQTVMPKAAFNHIKGKNVYDEYVEPQYKLLDTKYFDKISKETIDDTMYNKLK